MQADLVGVEPSHLAQQEAVVVLRQVACLEVREHPGQVDDGVVVQTPIHLLFVTDPGGAPVLSQPRVAVLAEMS